MRKFIIACFDLCTGCRICELACSMTKYGVYAPRKALLRVTTEREGLKSQPITCIQCENAICMRVCPVKAIERDEKTGAVIINEDRCIGCRECVLTCPLRIIYFDSTTKKAGKCDLCNGDPVCVKYCPTKAIMLTS
jgi:Fe-S-cluster-containing hydrogenase component 2